MIRGLYTAAAGMMVKQVQCDVISQNLANVSTPGYRRDQVAVASFPEMLLARLNDSPSPSLLGFLGTGCVVEEISTSQREGIIEESGNPLDLALRGNAYFVVKDALGTVFYTRNGGFAIDQDGKLITRDGLAVMGEIDGEWVEVYVPDGNLEVTKEGTLHGARTLDGRKVSRLALVAGPAPGDLWQKVGDSLFQSIAVPAQPEDFQVLQGFREISNVNPVQEMVNLISVFRAYEANQKVIQAIDITLDKAVNEVGRV
ncbi:MAG: Flagellar basal-body rod protein FlgG [Thermoanaerobacterales bacterium 50_218]|nr:MAG: Flagellar basal-body rod protein FlgG [Thermoanaerobacterales bacterium 50_218]HAA89087.1 flagellar basal-body rod protein FlgF [Peptococcaceae bacterium]